MKNVDLLVNNGVNIKESFELFGDMDIYNETLVDFLEGVDEKLADIKKYKEAGDMGNYAILVHSLKSDSKYLGFTKLAELAYNHEMKSKENDSMYVYENYDELMSEANRIVKIVGQYLGKDLPADYVPEHHKTDKKLLIVDDSDIIRNLIGKIFNNEYEVLTAKDGQEALEAIRNNPDLFGVFLDLNMPNVNGFAVLEYFKENGLFNKIPVAIITGEDTKENIEKAFSYTIVDVLKKPFNEQNVRIVLTRMEKFRLD